MCTGIDPTDFWVGYLALWFPRVYGDRPLRVRLLESRASYTGFPVCTGIDLVTPCPKVILAWFPRVYGDRPYAQTGQAPAYEGFPVCTGIDPGQDADDASGRIYGFPVCTGIDLS